MSIMVGSTRFAGTFLAPPGWQKKIPLRRSCEYSPVHGRILGGRDDATPEVETDVEFEIIM